ncbi:hypothetical protein JCM5296_003892 [Sporobolomyces johnsonii]
MLAASRSITARSGSSCRSAVASRRFLHQKAKQPTAPPSTSAEQPQPQSLDDQLAALHVLHKDLHAPSADIRLELPAYKRAIDFLVKERQAEVQYNKDMLDYEASFRFFKSESPLSPFPLSSPPSHAFPELRPLLDLTELPAEHTLAGLYAPEVTHIFNLISKPPHRTALAMAIEAWHSKEALRPKRKYMDRPILTKSELDAWASTKAKEIVQKNLISENSLDRKELAKMVDGILKDCECHETELESER